MASAGGAKHTKRTRRSMWSAKDAKTIIARITQCLGSRKMDTGVGAKHTNRTRRSMWSTNDAKTIIARFAPRLDSRKMDSSVGAGNMRNQVRFMYQRGAVKHVAFAVRPLWDLVVFHALRVSWAKCRARVLCPFLGWKKLRGKEDLSCKQYCLHTENIELQTVGTKLMVIVFRPTQFLNFTGK